MATGFQRMLEIMCAARDLRYTRATYSGGVDIGVAYDSAFQPSTVPAALPVNSAWRFGVGAQKVESSAFSRSMSAEYVYGGTLDVDSRSKTPGICVSALSCPGLTLWVVLPAGIETATSGSTAYSRPSHLVGG